MVARSLFPFDRTPARTITIVTKGWLRCCSELTEGCRTSRAVSKHWFPDFFKSTEPTSLARHDSERSCPVLFHHLLCSLNVLRRDPWQHFEPFERIYSLASAGPYIR
jgi:hypothetical protein